MEERLGLRVHLVDWLPELVVLRSRHGVLSRLYRLILSYRLSYGLRDTNDLGLSCRLVQSRLEHQVLLFLCQSPVPRFDAGNTSAYDEGDHDNDRDGPDEPTLHRAVVIKL